MPVQRWPALSVISLPDLFYKNLPFGFAGDNIFPQYNAIQTIGFHIKWNGSFKRCGDLILI